MNILIPCGGIGERFAKEGYDQPKPLVTAMGKPILVWLLENLVTQEDDVIVIAYNRHLEEWRMEDRLRKALEFTRSSLRIVHLTKSTRGAAETVVNALQDGLHPDEHNRKTMVLDCDTFYRCNVVDTFRAVDKEENMSVVFRDEGHSPIYSYCALDDTRRIRHIVEKQRISPWANTGCYCFESASTLARYCEQTLANEANARLGEFYMSAVIQSMLDEGKLFRAHQIGHKDFVCLGTPLQLRLFCATNAPFAPRRICFDLDGTLVTHPRVRGDYDTVSPYSATIEYARFLKSLGNTIIIQTARGMKSCGGNPGLIHASPAKSVYAVLERYNIPCDELYFQKPHADMYIDDLAHNVCTDLAKATGFYQTSIGERKHNVIEESVLRTVVKRSSVPLDGEIHWYKHAPVQVRHLFPAFIRHAADFTWYEIEQLESTSCSYLYVNECLTPDQLLQILHALQLIHGSAPVDSEDAALIYKNYASKVRQRYASYNYGAYVKSQHAYEVLLERLDEYEAARSGRAGIIHGDPVFSNVLMLRSSEIRFVDMRGKQGEVCTIAGDVWYDYAKLYQSLAGYDEILLGRSVSQAYRAAMLDVFVNFVTVTFGDGTLNTIKTLSASLFFTLIPLHDNVQCARYMEKCIELLAL